MSKNIKTVPTKDFEEVVATVPKYVEGLCTGNVDGLAQAFHKDAVMYGLTPDGELQGGPIKNLYDFVEKNGPAPDIKTRLDVPTMMTTEAAAEANLSGNSIIDKKQVEEK